MADAPPVRQQLTRTQQPVQTPADTEKVGPASTCSKHGLPRMFAWFPFIWPLKATFVRFDRAKKKKTEINKVRAGSKVFYFFCFSVRCSLLLWERNTEKLFLVPLCDEDNMLIWILLKAPLPNVGALISWPNLEILSLNLKRPAQNYLF